MDLREGKIFDMTWRFPLNKHTLGLRRKLKFREVNVAQSVEDQEPSLALRLRNALNVEGQVRFSMFRLQDSCNSPESNHAANAEDEE